MLLDVTLGQFKSFQYGSFALGAFSLLVGETATGKSNVRDALQFLHGLGLGLTLSEILNGRTDADSPPRWRGVRGGAHEAVHHRGPRFQVSAVTRWGQVAHHYAITVEVGDGAHPARVVQEGLHEIGGPALYHSHPADHPIEQPNPHQLRIGRPSTKAHRTQPPVSVYASHTPALSQIPHNRAEPVALRRTCEALLAELRGMRFFNLNPNVMGIAAAPGTASLGDGGEHLAAALRTICASPKRRAQVMEWLRALTGTTTADLGFTTDPQGQVRFHLVEANGHHTSAESASDGALRALALIAALLCEDGVRTYFFESIDHGFHPNQMHHLTGLIRLAHRERGVQVVGTTHNPALLSVLDGDALVHTTLAWRPSGARSTRLTQIVHLPDAVRVLAEEDPGHLYATGWLEDAANFRADGTEVRA